MPLASPCALSCCLYSCMFIQLGIVSELSAMKYIFSFNSSLKGVWISHSYSSKTNGNAKFQPYINTLNFQFPNLRITSNFKRNTLLKVNSRQDLNE